MRIDVITLFPELIRQCTESGVIGRALQRELFDLATWDPREFAEDAYRRVDDRPFGGGPGMVMTMAPLRAAIGAAKAAVDAPVHTVFLSPKGVRLTQKKVKTLATLPRLLLLCGRYEGVDQRLLEHDIDEEISLGDFVLSGGELAAAVVIDAVVRLQKGVLNHAQSAAQDSFSDGLLDCPHYTRPEKDALGDVPEVLLSGDHAAIRRWRRKQSLGRTWQQRPDLLAQCPLDMEARALLEEYRREFLAVTRSGPDRAQL